MQFITEIENQCDPMLGPEWIQGDIRTSQFQCQVVKVCPKGGFKHEQIIGGLVVLYDINFDPVWKVTHTELVDNTRVMDDDRLLVYADLGSVHKLSKIPIRSTILLALRINPTPVERLTLGFIDK